ncbi:hypothetical protein [Dyella amyloliquefaciens]|uniref:hypothetical protein n=1 Tax=Dyella amyloliquefaciens TaxID=1770545 RepID=UPI00102E6976|nr:hypothetical protein [Dyella amyloliquefaciens]
MSQDQYAAPATTFNKAVSPAIAIYSPIQIAFGTFLGGPVGLIYFLWKNFVALEKYTYARRCLILGAALIAALWLLLPFLPEKTSGMPFAIAYVITARHIAETYQLTKPAIAEDPRYSFRSNWNVVVAGVLCLVGSVVLIVGPILALYMFGIVK